MFKRKLNLQIDIHYSGYELQGSQILFDTRTLTVQRQGVIANCVATYKRIYDYLSILPLQS